jgi:hypothetical protein
MPPGRRFVAIVGSVATAVLAVFAISSFEQAFPSVSLDIAMTRTEALDRAAALAERFAWGPAEARLVASFGGDPNVQRYVELEAGGPAAFRKLISHEAYQPFRWYVRLFREGVVNQTAIWFTPAGDPYAFVEVLPEDAPGASLDAAEARTLAERFATKSWGVDLDAYEAIEATRRVQPSGRADHVFTYRRLDPDDEIGDVDLRMWLGVSGDRVTAVSIYIEVPEAFERRYTRMRGLNDVIHSAGGVGLVALFCIGGITALLVLQRSGSLSWRPSFAAGVGIALLSLLSSLNQLPGVWVSYDTAIPIDTFRTQYVVDLLGSFVLSAIVLSLTFAVADGLTRRAFPRQNPLWRSLRGETLRMSSVRAQTLLAYALVPAFFAYEVAFYRLAQGSWGWWVPLDQRELPDVLGTYLPWLTPFADSLRAGTWEESLLRAVPIAGAALIGERFGRRRLMIGIAVVLQAVLFGVLHANYPGQPGYARAVELLVPSLGFAWLYLRFGLWPGVILHAVYDIVWMGLPLLNSSADGARADQAVLVVLALLPLLALLAAAWQRKPRRDLAPSAQAETGAFDHPPGQSGFPLRPAAAWTPQATRLLLGAGVVGVVAWGLLARFDLDAPRLALTRAEALESARAVLEAQGTELDDSWLELVSANGSLRDEARFVWQRDRDAYRRLVGTYLFPPSWSVRRARFEGDVALRAEAYVVTLWRHEDVIRMVHQLPEEHAGVRLEESAARALAHEALEVRFGLTPDLLEEVSASRDHLPNRDDWTFSYKDPQAWAHDDGEALVRIVIAGDRVVDGYRFFSVPEAWRRAERERAAKLGVLSQAAGPAFLVLLASGLILAILGAVRGQFQTRVFVGLLAVLVGTRVLAGWNAWPSLIAGFATSRDWSQQAMELLSQEIVNALFAGLFALAAGGIHSKSRARQSWLPLSVAVGLGALSAGSAAIAQRALGADVPIWGAVGAAATRLPWLVEALSLIPLYLIPTVAVALAMSILDWLTRGFTRHRAVAGTGFVALLTLLAGGQRTLGTLSEALLAGSLAAALTLAAYVLVFRRDLTLLPIAVATALSFGVAQVGVRAAHPDAALAAALACASMLAIATWWTLAQRRSIERSQEAMPSDPTPAAAVMEVVDGDRGVEGGWAR